MTDDEIRAACDALVSDRDWATTSIDAIRLRLYRAAYAAGMEAAAVICDERKKRLLQWGLISAASEAGQAADAIRAAKP